LIGGGDGTTYFSFLADFGTAGAIFQINFEDASDSSVSANVADGNGSNLQIKLGGRWDTAGGDSFPADTAVLVVGKFETVADDSLSDTFSASVFTDVSGGEPAEWDAVKSYAVTNTIAFDQLRIYSSGNGETYELDEFRTGSTFASVIPEPATISMVATFGGLLLIFRRRMSR